jgi:hypothetical protein
VRGRQHRHTHRHTHTNGEQSWSTKAVRTYNVSKECNLSAGDFQNFKNGFLAVAEGVTHKEKGFDAGDSTGGRCCIPVARITTTILALPPAHQEKGRVK